MSPVRSPTLNILKRALALNFAECPMPLREIAARVLVNPGTSPDMLLIFADEISAYANAYQLPSCCPRASQAMLSLADLLRRQAEHLANSPALKLETVL